MKDADPSLKPENASGDVGEDLPDESLVGEVVADKYLVERHIATGGMGTVYLARHEELEREVALKIISNTEENEAEREAVQELFFQEAVVGAKLISPHITTVFDFGRLDDDLLYIVMEYLEGKTIRQVVETGGPLGPGRAIHMCIQICRALREAHERNIVHRDLKPSNVMLVERNNDPEFVKVLDFGVAKVYRQDEEFDEDDLDRLVGSPAFSAPEQIRRRPDVDTRADIYSFGALLYYMLCGSAPFTGEVDEVITAQLVDPPPDIQAMAPEGGVPEFLEVVVNRCLEKEPNRRFQTVSDLLRALVSVPYEDFLASPDLSPGDLSDFAKELDLDEGSASIAMRMSFIDGDSDDHELPRSLVLTGAHERAIRSSPPEIALLKSSYEKLVSELAASHQEHNDTTRAIELLTEQLTSMEDDSRDREESAQVLLKATRTLNKELEGRERHLAETVEILEKLVEEIRDRGQNAPATADGPAFEELKKKNQRLEKRVAHLERRRAKNRKLLGRVRRLRDRMMSTVEQ